MGDFGVSGSIAKPIGEGHFGGSLTEFAYGEFVASVAMASFMASRLGVFFSLGHLAGAVQKEEDTLKTDLIEAEKYQLRGSDGKLAATFLQCNPTGRLPCRFSTKAATFGYSPWVSTRNVPPHVRSSDRRSEYAG